MRKPQKIPSSRSGKEPVPISLRWCSHLLSIESWSGNVLNRALLVFQHAGHLIMSLAFIPEICINNFSS